MRKIRSLLVWGVMLSPMFAYPLAWNRIFGRSRSYFGDAQLLDFGCYALVFAGVALSVRWRELPGSARRHAALLAWGAALALIVLVSVAQQFILGGPWTYLAAGCFYALAPVAGMAMSRDVARAYLPVMSISFVVLLAFTFLTRNCTGLVGNWNWNFTLLAVTAPAPLLWLFRRGGWRQSRAVAAFGAVVVALLLAVSTLMPRIAPRGATLAVALASVTTVVALSASGRRSRLWFGVAALLGAAAVLAAAFHYTGDIVNARFQLWQSGIRFCAENKAVGVGPSRYESRFRECVTPLYHCSALRAERNPHPHNEFLYYAGCFGVVGAVAFALMVFTCLSLRVERIGITGTYMLWCWLVLLIQGGADVTLSFPLAGVWFLLTAGAIAGLGVVRMRPFGGWRYKCLVGLLAVAAVCALLTFMSGLKFRQCHYTVWPGRRIAALRQANGFRPSERAYYLMGYDYFQLGQYKLAKEALSEISDRFASAGYVHSNLFMARSCAMLGEYAAAGHYFMRERARFPFSILCQYHYLEMLDRSGADRTRLADEHKLLHILLKCRGLDETAIPGIVDNPQLDDRLPMKLK